MNVARVFRTLGSVDVRSIRSDAMLPWLIAYPLFIALLGRWGIPALASNLQAQYQFDLTAYYLLITSFLLLMMPAVVGVVIGFLLLDQRDDHTLSALQVTPMTLNRYLLYRTSVPILMSAAMTLVSIPLVGLVRVDGTTLLLATALATPMAPVYALFFAAFAQNKVQGFAIMKATGVILWPPIIAYFVSSSWKFAFGLFPTYWPARFFWAMYNGEPGSAFYFVIGLAYQGLLLALLLKRFNRVVAI